MPAARRPALVHSTRVPRPRARPCARRDNAIAIALSLAGLAALTPGTARAQTVPLLQGPEATRPVLPPLEEPEPPLPGSGRVLPVIPIPRDTGPSSLLAEDEIAVAAFRFEGNTVFSDESLAAVTATFTGPGRRYGDLLEARDRVTRHYIDAGYISSGATLPVQTVDDGVVLLRIFEGTLDEVEVRSSGRLHPRYVRSRLEAPSQVLNIRRVQERLAMLKRDPHIAAVTAELVPGEIQGSSLLSVVATEAQPLFASAGFDNAAPPSVGGLHGQLFAGHRNVTGWGDTLSAGYGVAEGLHDLDVRYGAPLTRHETTLEFALRRAWSEIVEAPLDDSDIDSRTESYRLTLRQPVLRDRTREVAGFTSFEWKRGRSFLRGEPFSFTNVDPNDPDFGVSTVSVLRIGAEWWERHGAFAWSVRGTANLGLDLFDATGSRGGASADGQFVSGLFQLQGVQQLPWARLRLHARLDGQVADGPLLGLEQLALGGAGSVRGYRQNRLVRDEGVIGSLELRWPVPLLAPIEDYVDSLELGVFSDVGYGRNHGPAEAAEDLYSVGLGMHLRFLAYAELHVEWAQALREAKFSTDDDVQDQGLHFGLTVRWP